MSPKPHKPFASFCQPCAVQLMFRLPGWRARGLCFENVWDVAGVFFSLTGVLQTPVLGPRNLVSLSAPQNSHDGVKGPNFIP